jgi:predicted RNase H-like nuclease
VRDPDEQLRAALRGSTRARVTFLDDAGATVAAVDAATREELTLLLARLVVLGSEAAPREPRDAGSRGSPAPVRTGVLVAGVDGYRRGWVAVSLDPSGDVEVSTHATFTDVLALGARVLAVDMPIDPEGRGDRAADRAARAFVAPRGSAVFPAPPRAALEARTFAEANERARALTGKGMSQQAFALGRKILEVQDHAVADERVVEIHPEVSFRVLAGRPLASKHSPEGLIERRQLLRDAGIDVPAGFLGVPETDLLDAAAGAWSAARYARGEAIAFPPEHTERLGAIWA